MFPLVWLCLAIVAINKNNRNLWWVYLVTCMWINDDIRFLSLTVLNILMVYVIIYAVWRIKGVNYNLYPRTVRNRLYYLLSYMVVTTVLITILSTGPILTNLWALKSSLIIWTFLFVLPYFPQMTRYGNYVILLSVVVLSLYGIYCYISSSNPFLVALQDYFSESTNIVGKIERSMDDARGVLKGRITGTSRYTIQYGVLMLLLIYVMMYESSAKRHLKFIFTAITLSFINIYLRGSRGPLAAFVIGIAIYYTWSLSFKKKLAIYILLVVFYIAFENYFDYYILSIAQNEVGGSTTEGRLMQFYGAYHEVYSDYNSLLFGRGPYFINEYLTKYGAHPLAARFESTHVSGIVTYGILGLIFIFIGTCVMIWKISYDLFRLKYIRPETYKIITSLIISYLIYNIMVGNAYHYLFYFIIYMMILNDSVILQRNKSKKIIKLRDI